MHDRNDTAPQSTTVPVISEEAKISRREVESGRVRIDKSVEDRQVQVSEPLRQQHVRVEHVPRGVPVDPAHLPGIRQEAGVTIVPVLEEVLVLEKRLLLKEEIHIHVDTEEKLSDISVNLKSEHVRISRTRSNNNPTGTPSK